MKFDVVIGNPPYQDPVSKKKLWIRFTLQMIHYVKESGSLSFVTPISWGSPNSKVLELFKEKQLEIVNTNIKHHFNVGSTFSSWQLKNIKNINKTTFNNSKIDVKVVKYIPNDIKLLSIHQKLTMANRKCFEVKCDTTTVHSSQTKKHPERTSNINTTEYKYPHWHTNNKILYSKYKSDDFDNNKVIWTTSGNWRPLRDNGKMGTTETSMYIVTDDTESLCNVLNSKLYTFIMTTAKWSGFLNGYVARLLPKIDLTRSWTDAELYDHFGLTEEERLTVQGKM